MDLVDKASELVENCLLPVGTTMENHPDPVSYYEAFRHSLNFNLEVLFDILAKNESLMVDYDSDGETLELRVNLVRLFCEQSAVKSNFQTDNKPLLDNLNRLIMKYFHRMMKDDVKIFNTLLTLYKKQLTKDEWRRHLGSVYGFERFCCVSSLALSKQTLYFNSIISVFRSLSKRFSFYL